MVYKIIDIIRNLFPKSDLFVRLPWFAFRIWWPSKVMGSWKFNNTFGLTIWSKNNNGQGYTICLFKSYDDLLFSHRNKLNEDTKYYRYWYIQKAEKQTKLRISWEN